MCRSPTWCGTTLGCSVQNQDLIAWDVLDALDLDVLFQFYDRLRVIRVDLLYLLELLLVLILGLDITQVIENISRLLLQVVYLLLEDVIHLLLIHLSLLLAGEADPAGKLLVFPFDTLGDCETRLVPQECDHLPTREVLDCVLFETQVLQFRLNVTF